MNRCATTAAAASFSAPCEGAFDQRGGTEQTAEFGAPAPFAPNSHLLNGLLPHFHAVRLWHPALAKTLVAELLLIAASVGGRHD